MLKALVPPKLKAGVRMPAVKPGALVEGMPAPFQFPALPFEIIEFPVHDDVNSAILVGERLVSRRQIDDAQPRMTQAHMAVGRSP